MKDNGPKATKFENHNNNLFKKSPPEGKSRSIATNNIMIEILQIAVFKLYIQSFVYCFLKPDKCVISRSLQ